jgi:DNA-directed RNA polymerase subunit RPC12/RpoP
MVIRFRDYGKRLSDFEEEILVRCPQCERTAKILTVNSEQSSPSSIKRITCQHCSYTKQQSKALLLWQNNYKTKSNSDYEILDHFFGLPLWLQTSCCGQVLWAYNEAHLNFLETYVQSKLRERLLDETLGWNNGSLASRLPRWIKLTQHREKVLQKIQQLKQRL